MLVDLARSLQRRATTSGWQFVSRRKWPIPARAGHDEVLSKLWSANEFVLARDKLLVHAIDWPSSIGVPEVNICLQPLSNLV